MRRIYNGYGGIADQETVDDLEQIYQMMREIVKKFYTKYDPNDLRDALTSAAGGICSENCLRTGLRHKNEGEDE